MELLDLYLIPATPFLSRPTRILVSGRNFFLPSLPPAERKNLVHGKPLTLGRLIPPHSDSVEIGFQIGDAELPRLG